MIINYQFISFLLGFFLTVCLVAQKKSRNQLEAERNRIKKEIKMVDKLLFDTQTNEKNALEALRDLNKKITVRQAYIKTISLELIALSSAITDYESHIKKLTKKVTLLKEEYAAMIYKSYKSRSQQNRTLFLFSSKSFHQAYKRLKYMKQYASFRKKQGEEVASTVDKLKQLKDSLYSQKQLKDILLLSEEEQKSSIESEKLDQQRLIGQIKKQESTYKIALQRKQQEEKKLSDRIDKIIEQAIINSSLTKKPNKSGRFSLTPEAKMLASKFEQNKGKLPWPVKSGLVVRRFGKQPHPIYPGNFIYSSGIHIATNKETEAMAIFDGKILAIQTQSEGKKSVLVRHGNYISIYNNLESVYVTNTEKVTTGQPLGKIFTDRITGKTKLIFVLSKNTTRLNPINWILSR